MIWNYEGETEADACRLDAQAAWAAGDAWAAWAARDARDALTGWYAVRRGWTKHEPLLLTTGLRDAYAAGLVAVFPTGERELGWTMDADPDSGP